MASTLGTLNNQMGFVTSLDTRKIGPQRWLLLDDLVFHSVILNGYFVAPRGFQTDFASIPRIFWTLYPPVDNYDPCAVIHDAAYAHALTTWSHPGDTSEIKRIELVKEWADKIFLESLLSCGESSLKAKAMYYAVKLFGNPAAHPLATNTTVRSERT